jgi:hypothetical protein
MFGSKKEMTRMRTRLFTIAVLAALALGKVGDILGNHDGNGGF